MHVDLLVQTAKRVEAIEQDGLNNVAEFNDLAKHSLQLGINSYSMRRLVRTDLSWRVNYELLREGKLRDSDTLIALIARRCLRRSKMKAMIRSEPRRCLQSAPSKNTCVLRAPISKPQTVVGCSMASCLSSTRQRSEDSSRRFLNSKA